MAQTLFERLQREKELVNKDPDKPRSSLTVKIIIFLSTLLFCTIFFSFHLNRQTSQLGIYNLAEGYIWPRPTMKADFTFPVYKDEAAYQREVNGAVEKVLPVFTLNTAAESNAYYQLDTITQKLQSTSAEINKSMNNLLDQSAFKKLFESKPEIRRKEIDNLNSIVRRFLSTVYDIGFINISVNSLSNDVITVRTDNNSEKILQTGGLIDSMIYIRKARQFIEGKVPGELVTLGVDIAARIMKPNLVYSQKLTDQAKELAEKSVPRTDGFVRQGETIISKGEQVTDLTLRKLRSYEQSKFIRSDYKYTSWIYIGSIGHALIIYLILLIYLFLIRKRIFYDNFQLGVLSAVLVLIALASWLSIEVPSRLPLQYFIFLPAFSMLVAIAYDSRTAFYTTVTMALIIAGIRGNDYDTGTAMLFAGTLGAYSVRDIQSRTQVFKSIFFIFIGFLIPVLSFGLERSIELSVTFNRLIISLLNAAIAPMITFGSLFILERISNVTTDLRLQEFNNLNHPLLIKMSETAPGTYQHTLSMTMLAEKCAGAVGANQLLTKVGAYFHDIGKIVKPEYFVENQLDIDNKHDLLTPKKSAEAIKTHVIEGIKLAKEYKLPQRIADFIPQHHGTSLIRHFYAKALEDADGHPVNEEDFRYAGPKPQSKEAAIIMICDSSEALSRIANKDREELEKAIAKNVREKLLDGQFDEAPVTMKDLEVIKETCVKTLIGMGHQRVEYKELPVKPEEESIK